MLTKEYIIDYLEALKIEVANLFEPEDSLDSYWNIRRSGIQDTKRDVRQLIDIRINQLKELED